MPDAAYLSDNAHLFVTGVTGAQGDYLADEEGSSHGGKSALATYIFDQYGRQRDLAIFGNFKHDDVADVVGDAEEVATVDELADAISSGHDLLVLSPTNPDWAEVSRRLEAFVRALPDDMSKLVVLDEAPELDTEAVLSFVRVHGNGANCKTLVLAQAPTDLPTSILKQVLPVWVGPMKADYRAWFRTHDYGEAFDYIDDEHEPYHWTVILGKAAGEWDHYRPVPEEYGAV